MTTPKPPKAAGPKQKPKPKPAKPAPGKRGEVKDARDRYANVEVSYLAKRKTP